MKKEKILITLALCIAGTVTWLIFANAGRSEIRNIVLISIDTCRADYLSCYGYPRETTPHIDAVARGATRFQHVVSPVPITLPAHSSLLTGTIPPFHGVHNNIGYQLAPSNHTLAEILQLHGFNTAAIISAYVLDQQFGLDQGFSTYNDSLENASFNKDIVGNERKGNETTQVALEWLDENKDGKSFLFLHYYDPHMDYVPPEPYASKFSGNPYAGEIAFTDHCIGQVIQKLKELKLYDSTLLIITGDHGEMLGEHGEEEHTYFIYESAIRVPLIVKQPGQKQGAVVPYPVGLVDIVPTICSMLEIDLPSRVQGMDFSSLLHGDASDDYSRYLYSESITPTRMGASSLMAISTDRWKYIQAPRPELYDITTDPGEENNLVEKEHHRARILEDRLRETLETSVRKDQDSQIQLDAETIKRLESLGYVAGKADGEIVFDQSKDDPKDLIHIFEQYHKARRLKDSKEYEQAKELLEDLIPKRPEYHKIYVMLSEIEIHLGQYNQAIKHYRQAKAIDPTEPFSISYFNNLAWLQATRPSLTARDVDEALMLAKTVCEQTNFRESNALDTLAVAYAAVGDFSKAAETARKAQKLASDAGNTELMQRIDKRLELYKQSKPYIEE